MERNLLIRDRNIQSVIFIVSLPVEIREAETVIIIDNYTWDRVGSTTEVNFKKNYPILKNKLMQNEKRSIKASEEFVDGKKVDNELAIELAEIANKGGLYLDKDFASLKISENVTKYAPNPKSVLPCEIPDDLKKS